MIPAAYASIDLEALKHNLMRVRQLAPAAKVMAVIKANAYGHGLLQIAKGLGDVDAVAVARVDEGKRLRESGFSKRIIILEGFVGEAEMIELLNFDLEMVVHSVEQVNVIEQYRGSKQISVWLKLDTGMNRLGFKSAEFSSVYERLLDCRCVIQPISLMTHFSSADEIDKSPTEQQMALFEQAVGNYPGEKSAANSAAIINFPMTAADWVRPGVMLYGVSPFVHETANKLNLKPVMSFYSRLISVKQIEKGEAVGYAGTWVAQKPTRLGVVAIGYGDGYPRYAETGTPVLVNGIRVSLVGRVSMDMMTVDLGDTNGKVGDAVTLWGEGLPVEEIASHSNTIPYTLLCGITQRVKIINS